MIYSGIFCNRLPVLCQNAALSRLRITLFQLHISFPFLFYYLHLPHVYIEALELHSIKSLVQLPHTAKFTSSLVTTGVLLLAACGVRQNDPLILAFNYFDDLGVIYKHGGEW